MVGDSTGVILKSFRRKTGTQSLKKQFLNYNKIYCIYKADSLPCVSMKTKQLNRPHVKVTYTELCHQQKWENPCGKQVSPTFTLILCDQEGKKAAFEDSLP